MKMLGHCAIGLRKGLTLYYKGIDMILIPWADLFRQEVLSEVFANSTVEVRSYRSIDNKLFISQEKKGKKLDIKSRKQKVKFKWSGNRITAALC